MDFNTIVLVFGIAIVATILTLLVRQQRMGRAGEAMFRFGDIFEASVKFGSEERVSADEAVKAATKQKADPGKNKTVGSIEVPSEGNLARVLWVDDNPDNNLYETVALERLGRFVTKTTSTEAALAYLAGLPFSVAISDLGRYDNARAGLDFVERARRAGYRLPVIIYTLNADRHVDEGMAAGATAVVDMPHDLVNAVQTALRSASATTQAADHS
jgi:CheY-like chemotaxis protein